MEVGFVGIGHMGDPMSTRLLKNAGVKLRVFDANPEAISKMVAKGASAASSPKDLADSVETVFLSLPTPAIVREVCLGSNGLIHGTKLKRIVDMSTTGSKTAIAVGEALAEKGIQMVDSPVSGGVSGAVAGTLAVMVSCPKDHFEELKPMLDVIGKVFFVGEKPGLGQTMKLANNFLSATALAATSEAVALGVKAGLDPKVMIDVINSGSGRNSASQDKFPRAILPGTFEFGFTSGLMLKDIELCHEEAERLGVPMSVADSVREVWKDVVKSQGSGSDFTTVARHMEDVVGVKMQSK